MELKGKCVSFDDVKAMHND